MTESLQLQVVIDPLLKQESLKEGSAVSFGDFYDDGNCGAVYNTLPKFYEDLILGRPLPLTFRTRGVQDIGTLIAIALFLHRDLAIEPTMVNLVTAADMVHRYPYVGEAHIDRDLARFFRLLLSYLPPGLKQTEQQAQLTTAVQWIRDYVLTGQLPALPKETPIPRILDRGTDGFVVAEVPGQELESGWVELYRMGFLRGVLFGSGQGMDRRIALVAKKSPYLSFDLNRAASVLNEAEQALGELPEWVVRGNWLVSPLEGSLLSPSLVISALIRA